MLKKYDIKNLDCADCAVKLESSLRKRSDVKSVSLDFATLTLLVDGPDQAVLQEAIHNIEADVKISTNASGTGAVGEIQHFRKELFVLAFSAVLFVIAFLLSSLSESSNGILTTVLFAIVFLLAGYGVLTTAFKNIFLGKIFDENFLMTIATIGAFIINAPAEAAAVMLFYCIGDFLQDLSVFRSRRSIRDLIELRPDMANLIQGQEIIRTDPQNIAVGSEILINPGERVPLDGIVSKGKSMLDTSALTGESVPRSISEGEQVLAGMINKQGVLQVKVSKVYSESALARIFELVENATHKKAETELFFTTFARYYTPVVVALALLVALLPPLFIADASFKAWAYRALVLLVISCPCALVVSIPLTYFGAIGLASKKGILIKGSSFLDALLHLKKIFMDKTGTITKGVFTVNEIIPATAFSKEEVLRFAALAEAHSSHPIAHSIIAAFGEQPDMSLVKEYQEQAGRGISAIIDGKKVLLGNEKILQENNIEIPAAELEGTIVYLAIDGSYAGSIAIGDEIKKDSIKAIAQLRKQGVKELFMLTGDNEAAAKAVCKETGMDRCYADLMPEDKVRILEEGLQTASEKDKVAFVGDGMNDAPVLARADIAISMGSLGSDAAIETADIVIMNDSLSKIVEVLQIAQKNRKILVQNIILALGIKTIFIVLGALGFAGLWAAVFADMGVALMAIFNATRMLKD